MQPCRMYAAAPSAHPADGTPRSCSIASVTARHGQMANNLEGGGKTPILSPAELKDMGFALVAYPLSLMGVAAAAMRKALQGIRADGSVPTQPDLPTFQVI